MSGLKPGRRTVLAGMVSAGITTLPTLPMAAQSAFPSVRWAKIRYVHTGQRFNEIHFTNNQYVMPALERFSYTVRDHRANKAVMMHPWLLDIVFVLHWRYMVDEINIVSGYRSPETNEKIEGAAKNSQHMRGMALDITIPGLNHEAIARDLATFVYGGVGMYPGRGFVHFDFGGLRRWVG